VPGRLSEPGDAVDLEMAVAVVFKTAERGRRQSARPGNEQGRVLIEEIAQIAAQVFVQVIGPDCPVDRSAGLGRDANFLRILVDVDVIAAAIDAERQ
jgi:hypothetical protein